MIVRNRSHHGDAAERLIAGTSKKGDYAEQGFRLKEKLADFDAGSDHPAVQPDEAELDAAILAWRASLPPPTKSEQFAARKDKEREIARARSTARHNRTLH